ncbi:TIGR01777 family oxidoreductase [Tautonia sp. JC769]|uniref:TIGR01777 family oxidoreductase n=1 Tax=Tautonia sp. JC769 TaxID=3232135 RepID=UPI00345ABFD1
MKRIVIAGGTGFIGSSLARHLTAQGYEVVALGRTANPDGGNPRHAKWDGRTPGDWSRWLDGADAVVNLAGRSVDCIKTPDHCDEILRSRVDATRAIGAALAQTENRPPVWVQMSTAHIYGDPGEQRITEGDAFGYGLAPTVGRAWEAALAESLPQGMREVRLRTSFVVGRGGGAMASLTRIARLGLGGRVGSGRQGFSWIHEADMNAIIQAAVEDDRYAGPYICSAPSPVSQAEFMRALRQALGIPIGLPAPAWLVRLGAPLVLRTDPDLALYGRYVYPERLLAAGFTFRYPELDAALREVVRSEH